MQNVLGYTSRCNISATSVDVQEEDVHVNLQNLWVENISLFNLYISKLEYISVCIMVCALSYFRDEHPLLPFISDSIATLICSAVVSQNKWVKIIM